jgi:hypothetical protein
MDDVATKPKDSCSFRDGFVAGWIECVGGKERDKTKLKEIAEAAADKYINAHKSTGQSSLSSE